MKGQNHNFKLNRETSNSAVDALKMKLVHYGVYTDATATHNYNNEYVLPFRKCLLGTVLFGAWHQTRRNHARSCGFRIAR